MSLHPMSSKKQPSLVEEHFEPVMEDIDENSSGSDASKEPKSFEGGKLLNESNNVTPRPEQVHSTCNCRGAYVHQVPL